MRYSVKTFGCKVNTYDSALIQKQLNKQGWKEQSSSFDDSSSQLVKSPMVHVVNTCAVTDEAVRSAKYWIRRYKRKNPHVRILVTGCAAQVETEGLAHLKEVDWVVANSHKSELANIANDTKKGLSSQSQLHTSQEKSLPARVFKSSIFKKSDLGVGGGVESSHTRLFLKIQDGCDSFCTFCVIPFARGKSRSLSPTVLVNSILSAYEQGVREVVLTGVHIGDYRWSEKGSNPIGLCDLVKILLQKTQMPRFRLSSLEPLELTDRLLDLCQSNSRICPHFHLSIQSAHSDVLKNMKRKYTAKDVEKCLMQIYQKLPKAFVGMDIIAGFPSETQEQFEGSYSLLKNHPWTSLHVFPYSPRQFTYAMRFYSDKQKPKIIQRSTLLRHLSDSRLSEEKSRQIGKVHKVLPLVSSRSSSIPSYGLGISRCYWTIQWSLKKNLSEKKQLTQQGVTKKMFTRVDCPVELSVSVQSINKKGQLLGTVVSSQDI